LPIPRARAKRGEAGWGSRSLSPSFAGGACPLKGGCSVATLPAPPFRGQENLTKENIKMMIQLLTGVFASAAILTGFMVITAKNPIISVFNLVLTFINASILLLIQGVEFLSLLLIIVYVGAIAILFLFVVMMLNIKKVDLDTKHPSYIPIGFIIGMVFV